MATTKQKMCTRHGKEHPVTDFPKDKKQRDKLSNWCKLAWREYRAEKVGAPKKVVGAKVLTGTARTQAKSAKTPAKAPAAKAAKAAKVAKPAKEDN